VKKALIAVLCLVLLPAILVRAAPPKTAQDIREQPEVHFVSFVLDDVQKTWDRLLPAQKKNPVSSRAAGTVSEFFSLSMRKGQYGDGAVLLPG
jgi:hypothetical protein